MGKKYDTAKVAAMYDLYQQGFSLAQVAEVWGVTRQVVYDVFHARGLRLRARKMLPAIDWNGKTYTLSAYGYYRKTDGARTLLHHDVWESAFGPVPEGYDVHHKDENKENNTIGNLELLTDAEHTRLHRPPEATPVKTCLACGKPLVRKQRPSGEIESPFALARRQYCDMACKAAHFREKPRGWKPDAAGD